MFSAYGESTHPVYYLDFIIVTAHLSCKCVHCVGKAIILYVKSLCILKQLMKEGHVY